MQDLRDFIEAVGSMIDDFGTVGVLLTRSDDGEYDPKTGLVSVVSGEVMVQCIVQDLTLQSDGDGVIPETVIKDGDKVAYVSPTAALIPMLMPDGVLKINSQSDRFIVNDEVYGIVTVKVFDLSVDESKPILFEIYLRK